MADVIQIYESELLDPDTGQSARITTVPSKLVGRVYRVPTIKGLEVIGPVESPSLVSIALAFVLESANWSSEPSSQLAEWRQRFTHWPFIEEVARASISLADQIAYLPLTPVESSPLRKESLAGLMTVGGTAAWLAAFYQRPLLIFVGPVGLILVRAAKGVATGLEESLHEVVSDYVLSRYRQRKHSRRKPQSPAESD
jgi:hypothetical protein